MKTSFFYTLSAFALLTSGCGGEGASATPTVASSSASQQNASSQAVSSQISSASSSDASSFSASSESSSVVLQSSSSFAFGSSSSLASFSSSASSTSSANDARYQTEKITYFDTEDGVDYRASTSGSLAAAIDGEGNIYMTGAYFDDLKFQTDFMIIKTSPDGHELWRNLYESDDGKSYVAQDIVIGNDGAIYIGGVSTQSYTASDKRDILIMKIDTAGIRQWTEIVPTNSWGYAKAIDVDSNDNIFIAGELKQNGLMGQFLTKYSSDGEEAWTNYYSEANNSIDSGDLLIDQNDAIYLTAQIPSQKSSYLVKVDNNGSQAWKKTFEDDNIDLAVSDSALYKTSIQTSNNDHEINVLKMDTIGNTLWEKKFDIANNETLHAVVSDKEGSLYLAGSNQDNANNSALYFSKVTSDGTLLWTHTYAAEYAWTNSILLNMPDIFLIGTHHNETPSFPGFESISSGTGNIYMIHLEAIETP